MLLEVKQKPPEYVFVNTAKPVNGPVAVVFF